jgi:hypothetical protein
VSKSKRNTTTVLRYSAYCVSARHDRENKRIEERARRRARQKAKVQK